MSRMFDFITDTWNPLGGACPHGCIYCWANMLCNRHKYVKYQGPPRIYEKELHKKFNKGDFVFVQDMSDLFAESVPTRLILQVLDVIHDNPDVEFLTLTKNPSRYFELLRDGELTENMVLGATIESDKSWYTDQPQITHIGYSDISAAPSLSIRLAEMQLLATKTKLRLFISAEPVIDFYDECDDFAQEINKVNPWAVAVGYDNYNHKLPEPSLEKTEKLISEIDSKVYRKTIRKAWWES